MFGLRVPLTQSLATADFDGVPAILYNSGLREPSQWLSKVNKKGEIFELQLEQTPDSSSLSSSDKDCLCICSDCATDDTGYGTDTDLHSSFRKHEWSFKDSLKDFSDVDEVLINSNVSRLDDRGDFGRKDFRKVEEDIDSLFQGDNKCTFSEENIDLGIPDFTENLPINVDSYFTGHKWSSDFPDLKDMSDSVSELSGTGSHKDVIGINPFIRGGKTSASGKKCECEKKNQMSSRNSVEVVVKLRPQRLLKGEKLSTVELCEHVLGLVPGHYGSSHAGAQNGNHRKKDRRVKIRGLIPSGVAAQYKEIKVGDCLVSVNDQVVSWDNLDSVLNAQQHQRQAKLVIKRNSKQKTLSGSQSDSKCTRTGPQSTASRLVQLVSGSNGNAVSLEDALVGSDWEPFYGAMYLSLEGVNSDNMQAKEDIVYQFPRVDNKVIASRGMFITLAGSIMDATQSTVQSTTLMVDNSPVHVVYHCEGQNLFVISAPENRFSLASLTALVNDLVRLLQVTHNSIQEAFTCSANHSQLDCFFALLHQSRITPSENGEPVNLVEKMCNLSQSARILPLPNEIKTYSDRMLTEFEAADFDDMSDSYYGCRRSYNILGSCLFYKSHLIANHLPRDDLVDITTYLRYHSLLSLTSDPGLGRLVVWREVYPTRKCHSVPEEQQFGYTEPLIARWFWLIVGYKNLIMCISLETGGCTKVADGVSSPDLFLIDQARAVLMQLYSQNVASVCQNSISHPPAPLVIKPDSLVTPPPPRHDLVMRSLKKLPHNKDGSNTGALPSNVAGGDNNHSGSLRRLVGKRKDSVESDNSSESSGESFFKFSRKGRLFPETADLLHNISESKEDIGPINANRKLTVGVDNCLFHFRYLDNLEGVVISSQPEVGGASTLNDEIQHSFQLSCQKIKKVFDNARKVKEQSKNEKCHACGLNDEFVGVREEGVMFTCAPPAADKKATPLCYWVVGRCLSRSMRREVYVCFHESTPQTVIELAFKAALGYLPL